jgi:hypothetical protein
MISKKTFVNAINNIRTQEKKASEFTNALTIYCDGHPVFDRNNLYLKSLLDVLKEIFQDEYDTIEWWLWENVEKKIWINYGKEDQIEIDLSTPEQLYDYLVLEMKDKDEVI